MSRADYFLKIDGIEGESKNHRHKGAIEIMSFSFGSAQQPSMSHAGLGAGKVEVHDAAFMAHMCKASPKLALACSCGQRFKQAVLTCCKAGGNQEAFYIVRFWDVFISAYSTGGSPHDQPIEEFSLDFGKLEEEYMEQRSDGTMAAAVKVGWDVGQNCPV